MTTLDQLKVGSLVAIEQVVGSDAIAMRLMEMGLTPGTEVKIIGEAPLGDPVELEVRGYRLSVRRSEAKRIEVSPG